MPASKNKNNAEALLRQLANHGVTHATGVPCSYLKGLFELLEGGPEQASGIRYIRAPREDTALGLASGISIGGQFPVVLMQNSGLGYSLNVLTSFNLIYEVPLLLVLSWRGRPGTADAVEHDVIGEKLPDLLNLFDLPYEIFDSTDVAGCVHRCVKLMRASGRPTALIVREGTESC